MTFQKSNIKFLSNFQIQYLFNLIYSSKLNGTFRFIYILNNFDIEKLMKQSPIRLKSSSKAKLKATRSPSSHNQDSELNCDQSRIRSSVHTIPIKQSPDMKRRLQSNFTEEQVNFVRAQEYHNLVMRSGSPDNKHAPSKNLISSAKLPSQTKLKPSKSFSNLVNSEFTPLYREVVSPQKSTYPHQALNNQTLPHIISPSKSSLNNDRSFIKIELGKKSPNKTFSTLIPTTRMISPTAHTKQVAPVTTKVIGSTVTARVVPHTNIIQQVHYQVSLKQIQLERKVKILESRIGQLHTQKNHVETQLHEVNTRLQYQNNFLRQKLNTYESRRDISSNTNSLQHQYNSCTKCQQNEQTLSHSNSQKLIKDLQKSQENEYHQSKQIHSLKKQLFETEEMLSKQINKSLQLLEELATRQNENEGLKSEIKKMKENWEPLQSSLTQMNEINKNLLEQNSQIPSLNERITTLDTQLMNLQHQISNLQRELGSSQSQNSSLQQQLRELQAQSQQSVITRDLLNDLQQNNQLLISAIRTLQASLKDSQKQITSLSYQKSQLQQKITQLESQLYDTNKQSRHRNSTYEGEIQNLAAKMLDFETELIEKNTQIEKITFDFDKVNEQLERVTQQLNSQCITVQTKKKQIQSMKSKPHQIEGNSSTSSSFYNPSKAPSDQCTKCDQLRKTVFRLNNHLNQSRSSIVTGKDLPEPARCN